MFLIPLVLWSNFPSRKLFFPCALSPLSGWDLSESLYGIGGGKEIIFMGEKILHYACAVGGCPASLNSCPLQLWEWTYLALEINASARSHLTRGQRHLSPFPLGDVHVEGCLSSRVGLLSPQKGILVLSHASSLKPPGEMLLRRSESAFMVWCLFETCLDP